MLVLYLLGVIYTLHVGRCDPRAGQSLPRVLFVALQYLSLQVSTQRLDIKTPERKTTRDQIQQSQYPYIYDKHSNCLYHLCVLSKVSHLEGTTLHKSCNSAYIRLIMTL